MTFKTLSPIIARTIRHDKIWDLSPGDGEFQSAIINNLTRKYNEFYGGYDPVDFSVEVDLNSVRKKRIAIKKPGETIYNRCYILELNMYGEKEAIKFAYDVGLGERNSMGFGMVMPV